MQPYSETIMEHFQNPQNRGAFENAHGAGGAGIPGAGPFMVIQISLIDSMICQAAFQCHNCGVAVAAGSVLTQWILGRTVKECSAIDSNAIISMLDGVPVHKQHFPEFAIRALRLAIEDAQK